MFFIKLVRYIYNYKFIAIDNETIREESAKPEDMILSFAIMEIEAWFLGLHEIFEFIDERLTLTTINQVLELSINGVDPEKSFFHPTKAINKIYQYTGNEYGKHLSQTEALAKHFVGYSDDLLEKNKCATYNKFYCTLFD